jgi:hypothetical protein
MFAKLIYYNNNGSNKDLIYLCANLIKWTVSEQTQADESIPYFYVPIQQLLQPITPSAQPGRKFWA